MSATWDPSNISANITLSNGNLTATCGTNGNRHTRCTSSQSTGKYYMEVHVDTRTGGAESWGVGVQNSSEIFTNFLGQTNNSIAWYDDGHVLENNATVSTVATFAQGDTLCMAVNTTGRLVWFRNGAGNWNNSGAANPATGAGGIDISAVTGALYPGNELEINTDAGTANFGGSAYAQTVPSGFINWDGSGGASAPLRFNANLDGLSSSGGFFRDPLARSMLGWVPGLIYPRRFGLRGAT